jgi:hypothetical protein
MTRTDDSDGRLGRMPRGGYDRPLAHPDDLARRGNGGLQAERERLVAEELQRTQRCRALLSL